MELIPPLVGSRAEAQTQDKDETLQDTNGGRGVCSDLCTHTHGITHPSLCLWAPCVIVHRDRGAHFTHRETEAQRQKDFFTYTWSWN